MSMISLNCLIYGKVSEKMFIVKIDENESVYTLKELIKEKNAPHLDHLAPSDLDLWMLDLSLDEFGTKSVVVNLDTYTKLSPPRKNLSSFFNVMDDDHLHIIAKTPGTLR